MRRLVLAFLLGIGLLIGGYYIFRNITKPQSTQHTSTSETPITTKPERSKGRFEQKRKGADIPEGQQPFFGKVTSVNGSMLTIQSLIVTNQENTSTVSPTSGITKTLIVKLDNETTYSGGKQSDISKNTRIAGIGKTNNDGSITAIKLEIKPSLPTK